jgi:hypothetical protein
VIRYHLPSRPGWTCVVCGDPYPCLTRREQLLDEFRGAWIQLAVFMSIDYADAATELSMISAQDLHARFFWYRYGQAR